MISRLLLPAGITILVLLSVNVQGKYDFTVRFYEYWNPTGLCAECGTNGVPVCCDDPLRTESCQNIEIFRCDTRFRYILRPFNAPLETAPNTGFKFFTRSFTENMQEKFTEGKGALLSLPNPNIVMNISMWTGRIQFLVDAMDKFNHGNQAPNETKAIIDRFLINLDQLQLGAGLTEETTYTGIHNISQLSISFQVNCSDNYYGSDCTTFCEPVEGVYNCDRNGSIICVEENRNPMKNCSCPKNFYDSNCTTFCEPVEGVYNCDNDGNIVCAKNRDISSVCVNCTMNYYGPDCTYFCEPKEGVYNCNSLGTIVCVKENQNPSTNCTTCSENYYGSDCATLCKAVEGVSNCSRDGDVVCIERDKNPSINCREDLERNKSGVSVAIIGGVVGAVGLLLICILLVLIGLCVILSLHQHKRSSYVVASNTVDCIEQPLSEDPPNKKQTLETSAASNPIYWVTESENLTTTIDSAIYDQPQLELTQSVRRKNAEPPRAMYETVDVPLENESTHTAAAKEVVENSTYSVVMKDNILDTPTSTDIEEQEKEHNQVFDDPEYGTSNCLQAAKPEPTTVFDCAEYECPMVTLNPKVSNINDGLQQPDATIFDRAEYESPGVPATSGYSVLNHSKAIVDPTTPTTQGTMNSTTTGEGYSTLHQNTNMEANSLPQNTLHPLSSPQNIYDEATSNGKEQSHTTANGGALIYHYVAVDSHVHHPTIKSSTTEGTPGYVNTTPGPITPETLDHYDLGQ